MIELRGKFNSAKVFTDVIDQSTISQIITLCNIEAYKDSQIRIMPDCHAGIGCVVGATMEIKDAITPNLVGVDIGCGMLAIKLKETRVNLPAFDSVIRKYIPSGYSANSKAIDTDIDLSELQCVKHKAPVKQDKAYRSIGTLGGGNHFIELDKDTNGNIWLVIHTGSRHLGIEVCDWYQKKAYEESKDKVPFELAYCTGELMEDYLHDMKMVQRYAVENRAQIARKILKESKLHEVDRFETVHNYIDTDNLILRKGAVSAQLGERILIPINMRDGSLVCTGKGNTDWNCSAPHGAGRLYSRSDTKQKFTVNEYKKTMEENGIFSSSINSGTLDECPMAYKPMESITENIRDTADIAEVIKPIYNFKAGKEE